MNRKQRRTLGATGDFPRGKLNGDDEGGLRLAIGVKDRTVMIVFGKEIAWLGLGKTEALALADSIRQRAEEIQ